MKMRHTKSKSKKSYKTPTHHTRSKSNKKYRKTYPQTFQKTSTSPERKEECKAAFNYLNKIRKKKGRKELKWDDRAYKLAVDKSKDMVKRNYFDHVTPEATCAKDMKSDYGFKSWEILAENCGGMTHYSDGNPIPRASVKEVIDGWMKSRGH